MKLLFFVFCCFMSSSVFANKVCSYESYQWNTLTKRAENRQSVRKPYFELVDEEIDKQTGCTVCREDQVWLAVEGVIPTLICYRLIGRIHDGLSAAINEGFIITDLQGYRVGKTRGDTDSFGRRTKFSNHSFGVALDINSGSNGLYDNCLTFNRDCRLIRGGHWQPESNSRSIKPRSSLVRSMNAVGLRWGGEIKGRQKDFMHFSITGY